MISKERSKFSEEIELEDQIYTDLPATKDLDPIALEKFIILYNLYKSTVGN